MDTDRPAHPWVAEGKNRRRFAVVGIFLKEWQETLDFVLRAEDLGFDAYWANDHPTRSAPAWVPKRFSHPSLVASKNDRAS